MIIGNSNVFNGYTLGTVTIPSELDAMGYDVFYNCNITKVVMYNSNGVDGTWFKNCSTIGEIEVRGNVDTLNLQSLADNCSVAKLLIGENVNSINAKIYSTFTQIKFEHLNWSCTRNGESITMVSDYSTANAATINEHTLVKA